MPILDISVQLGCATTAVINANPNYLLLVGQILFYTDGVNKDKYYRGDGVTLLSSLPLLGGSGGGGLTVGTTTITSGTNTRILYNNAGVVGEYLVTGTGTTAVLSTSPTFTTDITTPLIIGGAAAGSVIQYKGTTSNGTSTVAAHQFLVGNNGATSAFNVYNSGQVLFNGSTLPGGSLSQIRITKGTGLIDIGEYAAGRGAIWFNNQTPTASNFNVSSDAAGVHGYLNGSSSSRMLANGNIVVSAFPTQVTFLPAAATGSTINFDFTSPNNTARTASTNVSNFIVRGGTITFNPGALSTQYFNYFSANTLDFGTPSVATNVFGVFIEKSVAGTNATISNNFGIGTDGDLFSAGSNFWLGIALGSISTLNYTVKSSGSSNFFNAGGTAILSVANTSKISATAESIVFSTSGASSGSINAFTFTPANTTAQTASLNTPTFKVNGATIQLLAGALSLQAFAYFTTNTLAFVSPSTANDVYGGLFEASVAGTNATITRNWALGANGNMQVAGKLVIHNSIGGGVLGSDIELSKSISGGLIQTNRNTSSNSAAYSLITIRVDNNARLDLITYSSAFTTVGLITASSSSILTNTTDSQNLIIGHGSAARAIIFVNNGTAASNEVFRINTSSHLQFYAGRDFVFDTTVGSKLGGAANEKIGKWGVTPIVQPASANQAAVTGTAGALYTATEQTLINDLKTLVNQLRADLVAAGNIKGSA